MKYNKSKIMKKAWELKKNRPFMVSNSKTAWQSQPAVTPVNCPDGQKTAMTVCILITIPAGKQKAGPCYRR